MENKEKDKETEIPSDIVFETEIKTIYNPKEVVLVDDELPIDIVQFVFIEDVYLMCKFIELSGDFFHFKNVQTNEVVKVEKHQSIITALNKINFSPECTLEINCIGDG